tara:strand:- start:138 stop:494 length:357 start_codon:yes stop_codon:yes gene_type:complete
MNKSKFIKGNQYSYQGDAELLTYSGESQYHGVGVFKSDSGNVYHYDYENMTPCTKPEPQYPNPPLPHCEERIAFARGANIEFSIFGIEWRHDAKPAWNRNFKYRVKVEKTEDELLQVI